MALFIAVLIVMVIMLYFMYVTLKAGIENANRKVNKFFLDKIEEFDQEFDEKIDKIEELIERYEIKVAQKLHHLEGVVAKLKGSKHPVPDEFYKEVFYIKGMPKP